MHGEPAPPGPTAPPRGLRTWVVALLLGVIFVLPLALVNPPLHAPDEAQHMYKTYRISRLDLWAQVQGNAAGGPVPSSLLELTDRFVGDRSNWHGPETTQPLPATLQELPRPLDPARQEFADFTWTASYAPLAYAPQALAFAVGRAAGLGPLGLVYAGRLANAAAALALLVLAVALCPVARTALLLAGLLPMAAFEYASLAPDGMIIASALLFTALALRGELRGRWTFADAAAMAACGLVFCSIKIVYAPLLLIGLPAALDPARRTHVLAVHAAIAAIVLGGTLAWMHSTSHVLIQWAPGTDSAAQFRGILADPLAFAAVLGRTLLREGMFYRGAVGQLGWTQIWLPPVAYAIPVIGLVAACAEGGPRLSPASLAWKAALAAAAAALVMTALYLLWTPVGQPIVRGVQGRYLVPFAGLLAVVAASAIRLPRLRLAPLGVPAAAAALLLITHLVLIRSYDVL